MHKKKERERGSITIEAVISLSAFMFTIVTILSIVNICIVQAKIAYAINTTAREISQYSYLYSLTGLNDREKDISEAGKKQTAEISSILTDVNTVYNEIENLGNTGNQSLNNIDDILGAWDDVTGSLDSIEGAGSSIKTSIENIAKDPKSLLFGIAKLGATEVFDLAKSRLIAAPLAKVMCKKNLVDKKGGDVNAYLKHLGVVPSASGSYIDGLDFSQSTLFPYGSSEIRINVSYDVKVIALLPVNFAFHFNQTAVTHGWLAGEVSFTKADKVVENNTLWTDSTVNERANYIRHLGINQLQSEGYEKTKGLTDVPLYNPEKKEFVMISSMNPLWSAKGEPSKTLDDIDDDAMRIQIERLCGKIMSTTDGVKTVKTSKKSDGYDCSGASNKIYLVIPQDEGLEDKVKEIIATANTRGVEIEIVSNFGNGARTTVVKEKEKEE